MSYHEHEADWQPSEAAIAKHVARLADFAGVAIDYDELRRVAILELRNRHNGPLPCCFWCGGFFHGEEPTVCCGLRFHADCQHASQATFNTHTAKTYNDVKPMAHRRGQVGNSGSFKT